MALDKAKPGEKTLNSYFDAIGLKYADAPPYELKKEPYEVDYGKIRNFYNVFCDAYHDYVTKGDGSEGLLNPVGGQVSILKAAFNSVKGNGFNNAVIIGNAFCDYWITVATLPAVHVASLPSYMCCSDKYRCYFEKCIYCRCLCFLYHKGITSIF